MENNGYKLFKRRTHVSLDFVLLVHVCNNLIGFLPTQIDGAKRGNYGLMDQVAALHWVQQNIEEIGGNPENVTIIGHGYGATFANLLMLSPMARGNRHFPRRRVRQISLEKAQEGCAETIKSVPARSLISDSI